MLGSATCGHILSLDECRLHLTQPQAAICKGWTGWLMAVKDGAETDET